MSRRFKAASVDHALCMVHRLSYYEERDDSSICRTQRFSLESSSLKIEALQLVNRRRFGLPALGGRVMVGVSILPQT